LEAILGYQVEVVTMHVNDGGRPPVRSAIGSEQPCLGAPYERVGGLGLDG